METGLVIPELSNFDKFQQRIDLGAEIKVMQKGIFFIANINKCSIQAGHDLFYPAKVNIANTQTHCWFFPYLTQREAYPRARRFQPRRRLN